MWAFVTYHPAAKNVVDPVHERSVGAEILRDQNAIDMGLIAQPVQGRQIGMPETVDRLFGIADHEQCTRGGLARAVATGEPPDQLHLKRVGVLKFVDQNVRVPLLEMFASLVVLEQFHRPREHVMELRFTGVETILCVPGHKLFERPEQVPQGVSPQV
jgi:hypothetical protein